MQAMPLSPSLLFRKSNTYDKGFLEEFQVSTFDFTENHAYTHIMN